MAASVAETDFPCTEELGQGSEGVSDLVMGLQFVLPGCPEAAGFLAALKGRRLSPISMPRMPPEGLHPFAEPPAPESTTWRSLVVRSAQTLSRSLATEFAERLGAVSQRAERSFMRRLDDDNKQCYEVKDACECAAKDGCAWWHDNEEGPTCTDTNAGWLSMFVGKGAFYTSCVECPTQTGCSTSDLWERLGKGLSALKPRILRIEAKDEVDLEDATQLPGYEDGEVETGAIKKGDTPFCGAVFFEDSLDGSLAFRLRLNGTTAPVEKSTSVDVEANNYHFMMYTMSDWVVLQDAIENWFLGENDIERGNIAFVPFPSKGGKYGIFVSDQRVQATAVTDIAEKLHLVCCLIAFFTTSVIFRERCDHLRDGLQMMGLTDMAFYTSASVFVALFAIVSSPVFTFFFLQLPNWPMPGEGEDSVIFPKASFILIAVFLWVHTQTCFNVMNCCTCFTKRRPVGLMFMLLLVHILPSFLVFAFQPATPFYLRVLMQVLLPFPNMMQLCGVVAALEGLG